MASPTPALSQRVAPHSSGNHVAVKGAATAFHAHTPKPAVLSDSRGVHGVRRDVDVNHDDQKLAPSADPDVLPEVGSVKDKIGIFAKHSEPSTVSTLSETAGRKKATASSPHPSERGVAARLPGGKPPVPSRKPTAFITNSTNRDKSDLKPKSQPGRPSALLDVPERRDTETSSIKSHDGLSNEGKNASLDNEHIQRKPTATTPSPSQLAATKPRPVLPTSRTGATPPKVSTSVPVEPHTEDIKRIDNVSSPSPRAPNASATLPMLTKGQSPALPPRSSNTPMAPRDPRSHRGMLNETRTPSRTSSPSSSSLYGRAQNNSNSSLVNDYASMEEEALSDAIVASSLASSRASSARKSPPPPPPQRRAGNRSALHPQTGVKDPPSSPLKHTLRGPIKIQEEIRQDHRHHRLLPHKHPHKHHEGDRKRWRAEISEKARKRYEGVWAANKGLHVPTAAQVERYLSAQGRPPIRYPPKAAEMVAKVVVRDIWTRSRLPLHVLEQVWDLVDEQKIGLLTREEFVVGMWLIDQQLRGHKLPFQIPKSVWGSVKRVSGISLTDITFSS
ncbi:hypothetical protein BDV59DRAFT_185072 [Aspergillus ambiguus]|uniref:protein irs4 n=1 Tax=Aspergillus ambiguus TaxID=176160 RepID=UPI003CCE03FD